MERGSRPHGLPQAAGYYSGLQDYSLDNVFYAAGEDYSHRNRFYPAGQSSSLQDYSAGGQFYAADRLGASYSLADYSGLYSGAQDYSEADEFYAEDGMALAASEQTSDNEASPDGYSHVETNEFFECEDGVREIEPKLSRELSLVSL